MLMRIGISNFKSFKELQEINLFPYGQNKLSENIYYFPEDESYFGYSKDNNTRKNKNRVLKLALITGKNASGKSNFFEGIEWLKNFFLEEGSNLFNIENFFLTDEERDTNFQIDFIHKGYFLQYNIKFNKFYQRIIEEKLEVTSLRNKKVIKEIVFDIENGVIKEINYEKIKSTGIREFYENNPTRSLIKILKDAKDEFITNVFVSFFENLLIIHKNNPMRENSFIKNKIKLKELLIDRKLGKDSQLLTLVEKFVGNLDTGIRGLEIEDGIDEYYPNTFSSEIEKTKKYRIKTIHNVYDSEGTIVGKKLLDLYTNESTGTRKVVELSFGIISSLFNGNPVLIDELTTYFHNKITEEIIDLYRMEWVKGQLVFSTHNDNLLDYGFRKDQIYIFDKNMKEESQVLSLIETDFRNDLSTAKQYIAGKFGSFPKVNLNFLRDFSIDKGEEE